MNNFCQSFLLMCFLTTLFPGFSTAQNHGYSIERIGIEQGLSQSVVKVVLQDRKGFLWIGTQDGLNRFDGYRFVIYKYDNTDTFSLSHNTISAIIEDRYGQLWIGTQNGLNRYDKGKFHRIRFRADSNSSIAYDDIISLCEDDSGYIWAGTLGGGLHKYDPQKNSFVNYKRNSQDPHSLSANTVRALWASGKNGVWIGTSAGLCLYHHGRLSRIKADQPSLTGLFNDRIMSLYGTSDNRLIIGSTNHGIAICDQNPFKVVQHYPPGSGMKPGAVFAVFESDDNVVWAGTENNGLIAVTGGRWQYYIYDILNPKSLSHDEIYSIIQDKSGNIWAGTAYGLSKLKKNFFTVYNRNAPEPYRMPGNETWAVYEDSQGRLYTALHSVGLFIRDLKSSRLIGYHTAKPFSLTHPNVYCIREDREGKIWLGAETGLSRLDDKTMVSFVQSPDDSFSLPSNSIMAIEEDRNGKIWIGTFGDGIRRWEPDPSTPKKGKFLPYIHDPANPNSLSNDDVFVLRAAPNGDLWAGTFNGLNRFDGQRFTRFFHNPDDSNSLSHNTILCIHLMNDGSIWCGTDGGGLNHLKDGHWTSYTKKDGLPNNTIYGILQDNDSNLWISTNNGLSKFSMNKKGPNRIQNFDGYDGLPSHEFNQGAYFKNKHGEMFFGSIDGMIRFRPETITPSGYVAPVYITAFKIFDRDAMTENDLAGRKQIDISYSDNFFSFEFVALDYTTISKNQYAYQLTGFDEDWIYSGTRRYASYTNLDGGEYTFRVKATNSHGIWNDKPAEIRIIIHPPFWKTIWFRVLLMLVLTVGIYVIFRYRVRLIKQQNEELERKVHERTKTIEEKNRELELKNEQIRHHQEQLIQSEKLSSLGRLVSSMSHEINNPLNFSCGSINLLEQDLNDLKEKVTAIQPDPLTVSDIDSKIELTKTIKLGLERIRDIVVGMRNFSVMDESELIEIDINTTISYLLSLIRSRDRQGVMIHTDLSELPVIRGLPGQLNHAILNILKNAIEFTQKRVKREETGNVWIKTYKENDLIVISVRDDGVGIAEEHRHKIFEPFFTTKGVGEGTGLGLAISYGIIQHHHGWIDCTSEKGRGSEFKLCLPVHSEAPNIPDKT